MSISPLPPKSNEPSRPASPAADALEVLSLDDEAISPGEDVIRMKANINRKTSSWKGFKSHFSKAEMKLKSTFGDSITKERKAVDGTVISPVELSPDSVEESPTSTSADEEKTEKIQEMVDLLKNIEELGAECDKEITSKVSNSSTPVDKKDRRVDFAIEEPVCRKGSVPPTEGAGISRPTELSFSKCETPTAPPRMKKEKRLERLLSVPNIKLNKQDQNRLLNLRKTSNVEKSSAPSSSASASTSKNKSGNFMRRFSKYQFHCINQSIKH